MVSCEGKNVRWLITSQWPAIMREPAGRQKQESREISYFPPGILITVVWGKLPELFKMVVTANTDYISCFLPVTTSSSDLNCAHITCRAYTNLCVPRFFTSLFQDFFFFWRLFWMGLLSRFSSQYACYLYIRKLLMFYNFIFCHFVEGFNQFQECPGGVFRLTHI